MPHIVVPAAELARRMPEGGRHRAQPGRRGQRPDLPGGCRPAGRPGGATVGASARRPGRAAVGGAGARCAASLRYGRRRGRGCRFPGEGEGLVISVTLDDPASEAAHQEVITAIEQAADAVPRQGFPIDVTFPGEGEPDQVDDWISAHADPFYLRRPEV